MKNIKELGLELIELEDQVLLVDRDLNKGGDTKYYLNGFIGRLYSNPQYQSYDILDFDGTLLERVRIKSNEVPYRIIASTKPLEGLPLLVIEDELKDLAEKRFTGSDDITNYNLRFGFVEGYKKAKETYKFTEDDLRRAYLAGRNNGESKSDKNFNDLLKSLTKKELWIEVEEKHFRTVKNEQGQFIDHELILEPKITDNQIKAVWK